MSEAVDRIEAALKERYNVGDMPVQLASAVTDAQAGNSTRLKALLQERELYRWRATIEEALAVLEAPIVEEVALEELPVEVAPIVEDEEEPRRRIRNQHNS